MRQKVSVINDDCFARSAGTAFDYGIDHSLRTIEGIKQATLRVKKAKSIAAVEELRKTNSASGRLNRTRSDNRRYSRTHVSNSAQGFSGCRYPTDMTRSAAVERNETLSLSRSRSRESRMTVTIDQGSLQQKQSRKTDESSGEAGDFDIYDAEARLMQAVAAGDSLACAEVVKANLSRMLAVAQRVVGDAAEAEDIAQHALLQLWRNAEKWQPRRALISTWLYRVTLNRCNDIIRKNRVRNIAADVDLTTVADTRGDAHSLLEESDRRLSVQRAISNLPQRQKTAVILVHFERQSHAIVAETMGCSIEAVESLLSRARRTLKKSLMHLAEQH